MKKWSFVIGAGVATLSVCWLITPIVKDFIICLLVYAVVVALGLLLGSLIFKEL